MCLALLIVLKLSVKESRKSSSRGSKLIPFHSEGTKISSVSSASSSSRSLGDASFDMLW